MANELAAPVKPMRRPSPLVALAWEEWRQTRGGILTGLAWALPLILVILLDDRSRSPKWTDPPLLTLPLVPLFVWLAGALLFSGYGRNDLHVTFPRRLFVLPLSTDSLVIVRLGYSLLVMVLVFSGLGFLVSWYAGDYDWLRWLPTLAVLGMLYVYAVAWTFGHRPWLAAVAAPVLWLLVGFSFSGLIHATGLLQMGGAVRANAVFIAALPVAAALALIAWTGVARDRNGGLYPSRSAGAGLRYLIKQAPRLVGRDAGGFTSQDAAQAWLEWHRRGRWTIAFCLGVFLASAAIFIVLPYQGLLIQAVAVAAVVGVPAGTMAAGFFQIIVSERDKTSGLSRFALTRPCSTALLASARLKSLAAGLVAAYGIVFLLGAVALTVSSPHRLFRLMEEVFPTEQAVPATAPARRTTVNPLQLGKLQAGLQGLPTVAPVPSAPEAPLPTGPGIASLSSRATPASPYAPSLQSGLGTRRPQAGAVTPAYRPSPPSPLPGSEVSARLLRVGLLLALALIVGWVLLTEPLPALVLCVVASAVSESRAPALQLDAILWGVAIAIVVVGAALFLRAHRLRLLRRSALRIVLVGWTLVLCLLLLTDVLSGLEPGQGTHAGLPGALTAFTAALALLPFLPLAAVPLSIHRQRHG